MNSINYSEAKKELDRIAAWASEQEDERMRELKKAGRHSELDHDDVFSDIRQKAYDMMEEARIKFGIDKSDT